MLVCERLPDHSVQTSFPSNTFRFSKRVITSGYQTFVSSVAKLNDTKNTYDVPGFAPTISCYSDDLCTCR